MPTLNSGLQRIKQLHQQYLQGQERHFRILLAVQVAYFLLLFAFLIYTRNWPSPTQIAIAFFLFAVVTARPLRFLRDWAPFIFLLLSYEALRGISDGLVAGTSVHFPINVDRKLFVDTNILGSLPTHFLQENLWNPNNLRWYDYMAAYVHPLHFILPLGLAFVFWLRGGGLYWRFVGSYTLLTYAGLVTYILYPMAPPWYAANVLGEIPPVERVLDQVLFAHGVSMPIHFVYENFNPNPVAAMPSLHAAFPVLVLCVALHLNWRWGWVAAIYPIVMNFSLVYMGEHYVIDLMAGTVYGVAAYAAVWLMPGYASRWRARRTPVPVPAEVRTPHVSPGHEPSRQPVLASARDDRPGRP